MFNNTQSNGSFIPKQLAPVSFWEGRGEMEAKPHTTAGVKYHLPLLPQLSRLTLFSHTAFGFEKLR